MKMEIDQGL